jgi:hypothetical protein
MNIVDSRVAADEPDSSIIVASSSGAREPLSREPSSFPQKSSAATSIKSDICCFILLLRQICHIKPRHDPITLVGLQGRGSSYRVQSYRKTEMKVSSSSVEQLEGQNGSTPLFKES